MSITYRTINKITFPVFRIPAGGKDVVDGLVYIDGRILDDRNMEGKTLGARRLQTPHIDLLPLKKCVISHNGIIKYKASSYVDVHGIVFTYEKTKMSALKYYRIKKVEQKETGSLLWVRGVKTPFRIPRPPYDGMLWAGLLHLHGIPWLLYEYSYDEKKSTRRKI